MKKSLKIMISPAKKMNSDTDSLAWRALPAFLESTQRIYGAMRELSYADLKKLWKCNDSIAQLNAERLEHMDLRRNLTPAILAYEGIQYRYMAPSVFSEQELEYVQEHLRILSGFYGLLRPFDGVRPYRLEMQARLKVDDAKDLYSFWGGRLADVLALEADCVIDLASKEYSVCISRFLPKQIPLIRCAFVQEHEGKLIEKGTLCKMARGEMVRYLAENQAETPAVLRSFDRLGYRYSEEHSDESSYTFLHVGSE